MTPSGSGTAPLLLKALYSVAAMKAVQAREAVRVTTKAPTSRVRSYHDWVADSAEEGD